MQLHKMLWPILVLVAFTQSGCFIGAAAFSSTLMVSSTVASAVSYAVSGKTLTDHALSGVSGQDCKLFNLIDGKAVCIDAPAPAAITEKSAQLNNIDAPNDGSNSKEGIDLEKANARVSGGSDIEVTSR